MKHIRTRKNKSSTRKNPDGILGKYPKIPTRLITSGDKDLAGQAFGIGKKLLHDLSVGLGYSEIQAGAAASKRHEFLDGSVIELEISHGLSTVRIFVPPKKETKASEVLITGFKCFIFATIEKVTCFIPDFDDPPECDLEAMELAGERFWYDVSLFYLDSYVLLNNYRISSAGWGKYEVGQHVLLGPDVLTYGLCCSDSRLLRDVILEDPSNKMRHGYLEVYPLHILDDMVKKDFSEVEIEV